MTPQARLYGRLEPSLSVDVPLQRDLRSYHLAQSHRQCRFVYLGDEHRVNSERFAFGEMLKSS